MTATLDSAAVAGRGVARIDGPLKVTGAALYAADTPVAQPLYAVLVPATIARGRVSGIDESDARELDGVVAIMTHANAPRVEPTGFDFERTLTYVEHAQMPLQSERVAYWGQHVAVVIATSLAVAHAAAERLHVAYERVPAELEMTEATRTTAERVEHFFGTPLWNELGDPDAALRASAATIDVTYTTPEESHNPIEPPATIAHWNGEALTLHESTQWVVGTQTTIAHCFGIAPEAVTVIAPFIGGGFGAKGFVWSHTLLAAMAAKLVQRPVKLVVERDQFFTSGGHRSRTEQRLRLGAATDGRIAAIVHDTLATTSRIGDFHEACGSATPIVYDVANLRTTHRTVRLDTSTATAMRAPGEAPGSFALESAVDEIACALGLDPLEVRVRNQGDVVRASGKPFSSKHLVECYRAGAERFGWSRRANAPRLMRENDELIGFGMGTATYPALTAPASVRVRIERPGRIVVESATHDLGTGMYTILAQVAAGELGVPLDHIDVRIGDSRYPSAPVAGGSQSTAAVMPPLVHACAELMRLAKGNVADAAAGLAATASADGAIDDEHFEFHSFGAHFCEVRVDEELARVRVTRWTGVFDCGRILNPRTTRSQLIGGIVMGLGMALFEETVHDPSTGAVINDNLADYHVAVNADVPPIDIALLDYPDTVFNPLGVRGVGEIGITGVAAAVANAIYHATGRRVRDLPIVPEKLL